MRRERGPAVPPRLHRQANAPGHSLEDDTTMKKKVEEDEEREGRQEKAGGLLPVAYIPFDMPALAFNLVLAHCMVAILQT